MGIWREYELGHLPIRVLCLVAKSQIKTGKVGQYPSSPKVSHVQPLLIPISHRCQSFLTQPIFPHPALLTLNPPGTLSCQNPPGSYLCATLLKNSKFSPP